MRLGRLFEFDIPVLMYDGCILGFCESYKFVLSFKSNRQIKLSLHKSLIHTVPSSAILYTPGKDSSKGRNEMKIYQLKGFVWIDEKLGLNLNI